MRNILGSSPLSRGILAVVLVGQLTIGIIPALAGNTTGCPQTAQVSSDHPRSRGEYAIAAVKLVTGGDHPRSRGEYFSAETGLPLNSGSSPLSRGIQYWRGYGPVEVRIIPALAGNTCINTVHAGFQPDHPRSRGEY